MKFITQRTAVDKIREYLSGLNMEILSLRYKKGKVIEVDTSNGTMEFQFGVEFKRLK